MKMSVLFVAVALVGAYGCKSKVEEKVPQEFTHVPVYVAAGAIPSESQEKIISNPGIRAYAIGRYIDPNRKTVMHEQHTVYRLEHSSAWNLIPQPDADPVLRAQAEKQERYADILLGQVTRANEDMKHTRQMLENIVKSQQIQSTSTGLLQEDMGKLRQQYDELSNNLKKYSLQLSRFETELKKQKNESELLKFQTKTQTARDEK